MRIQIALLSLLTLLCLTMVVPAAANDVLLALLYTNGPCNCYVYAWQIQNGSVVSDSVLPKASGTLTSFTFGAWVAVGDQPTMVSWSIGTSPFSSDIAAGTASLTNGPLVFDNGAVHNGNLNGTHFDVWNSTASGLTGFLAAGNTYWFTLFNGVTQNGGFMGWDENNGLSIAEHSLNGVDLGPIPSEDPDLFGYVVTPEPDSVLLFASGVLALAGAGRRRLGV